MAIYLTTSLISTRSCLIWQFWKSSMLNKTLVGFFYALFPAPYQRSWISYFIWSWWSFIFKVKRENNYIFTGASSSQEKGLSVCGCSKDSFRWKKGHSNFRGKAKVKTCRYCHKDGHEIPECYKLKKKEIWKRMIKTNWLTVLILRCWRWTVVIVWVFDIDSEWILNSVYTYHICLHEYCFSTFEPIHNTRYVLRFDDSECKIEGISSIYIKMFDDTLLTLIGVRFILKIKET